MLEGLARRADVELCLLAARDQVHELERLPGELALAQAPRLVLPWTFRAFRLLSALPRARALDAHCAGVDRVYSPQDFALATTHPWAVTFHGAHDWAVPGGGWRSAVQRARLAVRYRRLIRGPGKLFVVSATLGDELARLFSCPPTRFHRVGNGVEEAFFTAGESAVPPSGPPQVLSVGGLTHLDGGDVLLSVARALQGDGVRFLVAGAQFDPPLHAQAAAMSNVDLLGHLSAAELIGRLRDATLLFHPSRYESFGLAVAEAMAAGVPVVTSDRGGLPEVVGDGGEVVDLALGGQHLADVVREVIQRPALRSALSARARERAAAFRWGACVERLVCGLRGD